jgi:hypothetical protein
MKNKKSAYLFLLLIAFISFNFVHAQSSGRYYYQLTIYSLKSASQKEKLHRYLKDAYVPAMHRAGIKQIGIFQPVEDSILKVYVFCPYKTWNRIASTQKALDKDKSYLTAGSEYINASFDSVLYDRMEVILLRAFEGMPSPAAPQLSSPKEERVYELRSYEGPTEKYYRNKVQMFNNGEIELFKKLGFNALFYGEVLFGSRMPNLMYMTCHANKAARDENWKIFSADPLWKKMSTAPEYQHNVSKNTITFLRPSNYSDY